MSDTDDTDDLLLIPPDFFIIHSDPEDSSESFGPYYEVVSSLITQVNKLENRVSSIETGSDTSLDYFSPTSSKRTNLMSGVRRYNSLENISQPQEVYLGSTQSTPQKPRIRAKLNSLPSTPGTERHVRGQPEISRRYRRNGTSYILQPSDGAEHMHRTQNQMLSEIDNFISNVKTIQKSQAARNLNSQFDACELSDSKSVGESGDSRNSVVSTKAQLNLRDVNQLLQSMESQQRDIESRLKEKEQELCVNRGNAELKEHFHKEKLWQPGENKSSVPDRGMGMRNILYEDQFKNTEASERSLSTDQKGDGRITEPKEYFYERQSWQQGDNKGSVPDREMGMRDILYDENYKVPAKKNIIRKLTVSAIDCQEPSASDLSVRNTESLCSDNTPSLSSSDSSQLTAFQNNNSVATAVPTAPINVDSDSDKIHSNAVQVLNLHKNLLARHTVRNPQAEEYSEKQSKTFRSQKTNTSSSQNDFSGCKLLDYDPSTRNTLALLSLSELWNHPIATDLGNLDRSKFLNKLQEEKLRRQHCEQLIQQMQTRTLELQERLAVAVQVDRAKDDAILRVHKSWEESVAKIDTLNNEIGFLEEQLVQLKEKTAFELAEASKKISHYENESSKALNLAHSSQEKLVSLEKQNSDMVVEIQSIAKKLQLIQGSYTTEHDNNQQLAKILSQKEIELNENKNILSEARKEVAQSKRAVEICQAELTSMKAAQTQLELQISEELSRIRGLENEKEKLLADIETHKKMEKALQDDLNKQRSLSEQNKVELRNFYQDQVEAVVRDKLREFQSQLEKAENSLQDELRNRELAIAKAAAVHIQQVTEKHCMEIQLLEEKHREEVKLYKLQLSQAQQQIENLHMKFQQQQERRSNIAQQLHKVMEAQWLEALKIINNGKSPVTAQDKSTNTIDQLNFLKSKSYNNLEEILLKEEVGDGKACGDSKSAENISSAINGDSYDRSSRLFETPVSSRPQKNRQQLENELQKYVQMLLSKVPGNPTDEQMSKYNEKLKNLPSDNQFDNHSASAQWQQASQCDKLQPEGVKSNKSGYRDKSGKPPWK